MGDDNKAVSYFNKVVALGKDTASENLSTFLVNLGMAKIKLGLKADANSACQEALLIGKRNNLSEVCAEANECIKLVQATWILPILQPWWICCNFHNYLFDSIF